MTGPRKTLCGYWKVWRKAFHPVMDWEKVAFKDFSGEMCKLKWLEVSHKVRKFHTLKELVLEAKENVSNLPKKKTQENT